MITDKAGIGQMNVYILQASVVQSPYPLIDLIETSYRKREEEDEEEEQDIDDILHISDGDNIIYKRLCR